jgi:hypothetical protein
MMKKLPLLLSIPLLLLFCAAFAQEEITIKPPLKALSQSELLMLSKLPELKAPACLRNRELPVTVDNAQTPYLRPAFNQDGYSCGQASAIGYNFTYEIDRARNLPANLIQNQYPTHFSWNFMNGGSGWYGVSYFHSFQILKHYGMPNVVDYGGTMSFGGPVRWLSGYTPYFNGMHNRINGAYQIRCKDEEGLETLKGWLYDHLDSSAVGGVASFYAQHTGASQTLPAGTPEAGSYVITYFGGSPNHAMTIVGYHDSIRWDYNNDGQYTNHLDINNDGDVNMKDWEIGGFRMVQSYGGVPNWGDTGFAYMMYKTLADELGNGGVWNHAVHIVDVKPDYDPLLTARIILTHDKRNAIKIITGISGNPSATRPDYRLEFPIFDYQGGNNYMQGGTDEADKTIEIGLDLSPMLTWAELNQGSKLFLEVVEDDPNNAGTGMVDHFSTYDLTGAPVEIISPMANVPINENDTTRLSLNHTLNFDRVEIVDEFLPPISIYQPFSHQLTADGGTTPYTWQFEKTYPESNTFASFPAITSNMLTPSNYLDGMVTQPLDFDFPFFDSSYSSVTMHVDGYLMFDEQLFPYPYFNDDKVLFEITRNISPCMTQNQQVYPGWGQGMWYEGDSTYAIFRWKTAIEGNNGIVFDFAVKLFPDGKMEFFYRDMEGIANTSWIAGISDGDDVNFQRTVLSNQGSVQDNRKTVLTRYNYPDELDISENGLITGIVTQPFEGAVLPVRVTDNNFISSTTEFVLSSDGIVIEDSVSAGGDGNIEFGETVLMSIFVTNVSDEPVDNAELFVSAGDEYITFTDSTEYLGTLTPGITSRFVDAISYSVDPSVPNDHLIVLNTTISNNDSTWESILLHTAYAPELEVMEVIVDDENGMLDPGDTSDVVVTYQNLGGAAANNIITLLDEDDTLVEVINGYAGIVMLEPGASEDGTYLLGVSEDTPNGQIAGFTVDITAENYYATTDSFSLVVGFNQESFESGDFSLLGWGFKGDRDWQIDNTFAYDGVYGARSGFITHNQSSAIIADMEVLTEGEISFHKKVSCEDDESGNDNFDFLAFYIDGVEQQRWDGTSDWSYHAFPVPAGSHRFEWRYSKDQSVSAGMDGAWIDLISFPSVEDKCPQLPYEPESFSFLLRPGESETDTLTLSNTGFDVLGYTFHISGIEPAPPDNTSRSILGTFVHCSHEYIHQDVTTTLVLNLYNTSPDDEWIKDIYIELPSGIELTTATDFVGGTAGDLVFQGPLGNGITAHWHGEENNWGVLKGGETATAEIIVLVHGPFVQEIIFNYEVHGDVYGAQPHIIQGDFGLTNLGDEISWLVPDTNTGIIPSASANPHILEANTTNLVEGIYNSWIILDHYFDDNLVIPVELTVDQTISIREPGQDKSNAISVQPNPSDGSFVVTFEIESRAEVCITMFDYSGRSGGSKDLGVLAAGRHQLAFDTRTDFSTTGSGIYILRLTCGEQVFVEKVIILSNE